MDRLRVQGGYERTVKRVCQEGGGGPYKAALALKGCRSNELVQSRESARKAVEALTKPHWH
eukprot:735366-Pelagomonas_calceolata.AAC.3